MHRMIRLLPAALAAVFLAAGGAHAQAPEFYKGKTIRFIVGFTPGGGFDTYVRVISRHMGRHIPGNPTFVVENMSGAGSMVLANYMYKAARPDGLTIGSFHGYQILNQILGTPGAEYDFRKFEWIGAPLSDSGACALTKASGITSLEQWQSARTPVKLGATSRGDATFNGAKILKDVLGLPVQVVVGYKGTAEIRLAADAGEVAGGCWQWESIKVTWRKGIDAGDVAVLVQTNHRMHPELQRVPLAMSLAKTEEQRLLLKAAVHDPNYMTRPYSLPPGTPKDRVQLLRKALADTFKDPQFVADAGKSNLDLEPMSGEEVEKTVAGFFSLDPAIVAKLREILK